MKKIIRLLTIAIVLGVMSAPVSASAMDKTKPAAENMTPEQTARVQHIIQRVEEIKAMDRSKMTRGERKELRNELKELKNEARAITSGGIYLSVGAILIIILVLLILL